MGRSHEKGRRFEQEIGKWLLENDGECPKFKNMTTSTGRLGQQTNLQIDLVSKTYAGECKHRDSVPKWLLNAWKQIVEKAESHKKDAFLAIKKDARKYPTMHIITPEHHAELIAAAKERDRLISEIRTLRDALGTGELDGDE